jgi:hypothetical protein
MNIRIADGRVVIRGGKALFANDCDHPECQCDVTCGIPSRSLDGITLELYINDEWTPVTNPSDDFTNPLDIGYYCEPFECNALSGFCLWWPIGSSGPTEWYSVFGPGYGRVCAECPAEPTHTLCLPTAVGPSGPGPTPSYGVPVASPQLIVPEGEACEEWYVCDSGDPCNVTEWRFDVANNPAFAQDCSECVEWCDANCNWVSTGRDPGGGAVLCDGCNPLP